MDWVEGCAIAACGAVVSFELLAHIKYVADIQIQFILGFHWFFGKKLALKSDGWVVAGGRGAKNCFLLLFISHTCSEWLMSNFLTFNLRVTWSFSVLLQPIYSALSGRLCAAVHAASSPPLRHWGALLSGSALGPEVGPGPSETTAGRADKTSGLLSTAHSANGTLRYMTQSSHLLADLSINGLRKS